MEKIKLFVDFNNADVEGRIRLNTNGTFKDIKENNIELKDGLEVLLDDNEEFKIYGIVEFSKDENIWVAKIDWSDLEK